MDAAARMTEEKAKLWNVWPDPIQLPPPGKEVGEIYFNAATSQIYVWRGECWIELK